MEPTTIVQKTTDPCWMKLSKVLPVEFEVLAARLPARPGPWKVVNAAIRTTVDGEARHRLRTHGAATRRKGHHIMRAWRQR